MGTTPYAPGCVFELQYFFSNKTIGFVIKIFILSIFEWPFYTGFTVYEIKKDITKFAVFGVDR